MLYGIYRLVPVSLTTGMPIPPDPMPGMVKEFRYQTCVVPGSPLCQDKEAAIAFRSTVPNPESCIVVDSEWGKMLPLCTLLGLPEHF